MNESIYVNYICSISLMMHFIVNIIRVDFVAKEWVTRYISNCDQIVILELINCSQTDRVLRKLHCVDGKSNDMLVK